MKARGGGGEGRGGGRERMGKREGRERIVWDERELERSTSSKM